MRRLGVVAVVLVVPAGTAPGTLGAAAAAATDPWGPVVNAGGDGSRNPRLVTDDRGGNFAVVFAAPSATGRRVVVRRDSSSADLGPVQTAFGGLTSIGGSARAAVGRDGVVWVTVRATGADGLHVRVVGVRPDGTRVGAWKVPSSGPATVGSDPQVVVRPGGAPTLLWLARVAPQCRGCAETYAGIRYSRFVSGAWTAPAVVTQQPVLPEQWDHVVDSYGKISVAWTSDGLAAARVRSMSPQGVWGSTTPVHSPGTAEVATLALAGNGRGDIALVWRAVDATGASRVRAAYRPTGTDGWAIPSAPLSESGVVDSAPYTGSDGTTFDVATTLDVAVGRRGEAQAVWVRDVGGTPVLESAVHLSGASWGFWAQLSLPGHRAYEPAIIIAYLGVTTVAWSDSTGSGSRIVAHRVDDNGAVQRTTLSDGEDDYVPVMADRGPGNTFVAWTREIDGTPRAQMRGGSRL